MLIEFQKGPTNSIIYFKIENNKIRIEGKQTKIKIKNVQVLIPIKVIILTN